MKDWRHREQGVAGYADAVVANGDRLVAVLPVDVDRHWAERGLRTDHRKVAFWAIFDEALFDMCAFGNAQAVTVWGTLLLDE